MTLAAGTRIGPYEIVAPLGAGGMGEVYKARDARLDRFVALKVLGAAFRDDPAGRERFEREARAIAALEHPHICVLHDVGQHEGADYLVMEYLEGETLASRPASRTKGLPLKEALDLAIQIASALDEYATAGVLADLIMPQDERSGGASDAGVPAFMDFMMIDQPQRQTAMRGGLALIDRLSALRFDNKPFASCSDAERRQLLDEIAYPQKARPEMSHAVAFFLSFRDLTSTGFWSSKMGVDDLQYSGNVFIDEWNGCPDEALKKLGVKYS